MPLGTLWSYREICFLPELSNRKYCFMGFTKIAMQVSKSCFHLQLCSFFLARMGNQTLQNCTAPRALCFYLARYITCAEAKRSSSLTTVKVHLLETVSMWCATEVEWENQSFWCQQAEKMSRNWCHKLFLSRQNQFELKKNWIYNRCFKRETE